MLFAILRFELRYWLKAKMVWIFFAIVASLAMIALSDDVTGGQSRIILRNAPFVVESFYALTSTLTLLMTVAFVNSAATRDFTSNFYQILFTKPIRHWDFLIGRYLGSAIVAMIPMLGVSAAFILIPETPAYRYGYLDWYSHFWGIVIFVIPNTLFIGAIIFSIAALTRSSVASFIAGLLLLVSYGLAQKFLTDLDDETLAMLLDPFGFHTFTVLTKYWPIAERNTRVLELTGPMLLNRLIWFVVGLATFLIAGARFSFSERSSNKPQPDQTGAPSHEIPLLPALHFDFGWNAQLAQFWSCARRELLTLVQSASFIVIAAAAMMTCITSLAVDATEMYGNSSFPVTYIILKIIAGATFLFLLVMIVYYAGALVWEERETRTDEMRDTLPIPNWIPYASKLTALIGAVFGILFIAMISGLVVQTWHWYFRYQPGVYASEMFLIQGSLFVLLAVLAFFLQVIAPNKYAGYFLFIAFAIFNNTAWRAMDAQTNMVVYAQRPGIVYSDFFGRAPFWLAWNWFTLYWMLFASILAVASIALWQRGTDTSLFKRIGRAVHIQGPLRLALLTAAASFMATAAWVYYNSEVLHQIKGLKDSDRQSAEYEKQYKWMDGVAQPRITSVRYTIDIYPQQRSFDLVAHATVMNKSKEPISQIFFTLDDTYTQTVEVERATLQTLDKRYAALFNFNTPLLSGESRQVTLTSRYHHQGFANSSDYLQFVQNGTFFNNLLMPRIGYQSSREVWDVNDRKSYGLSVQRGWNWPQRNCTAACMDSYFDSYSDWVDVDTVISTSADQIAVAPGSLLNDWTANGRRYFHYQLDHPSLNFYSFISANYQVAREEWNGVKIEVYYLPEHSWNVHKMVKSIRKTLEYGTTHFGPYPYKQARIIEFPRVAGYAQAFPGTMPYSESIGFIAKLTHPDDIDMVYYIVAHEMAHQWWAHQVVGAKMLGATFLSETLAQYTALMVMEHEYGRDMMRKFLRYEMDRYLRSRPSERWQELPLFQVSPNQGYVHYQKGSLAMYALKEAIGEEAVNRALRTLIKRYAYHEPPYPTSYDLLDALNAETPAESQYLIKDLFETITLFSNRTVKATAQLRVDDKYDVTIEVEANKLRSDQFGYEYDAPLDDWIEIGAFAKPDPGRKYGRTLYRKRVHMTDEHDTFVFRVNERPDLAGIDPFHLLIDRDPEDNMKKVKVLGILDTLDGQ